MYKIFIKPFLFLLSPEGAHHFVFYWLRIGAKIPGFAYLLKRCYCMEDKRLERTLFGIKFPNPVGLGAGFDKDATTVNELANLGFGFIEVGTVTPVGQPGNPKPRLFRLPKDAALIKDRKSVV